ncbi:hypothetical protein ACO2Q8_16560 [Larkinella sp. VNQ87]|uniref:hypothetical protein n=1 Tax=Larkinella sp. VNQ87 TaxID=3400921 RepID=UPI003C053AA8
MKKPRNYLVNFEVNPGSELHLRFSKKSGLLEIRGVKNGNRKAIEKIHIIASYSREKNEKIMNSTTVDINSFDININDALIKSFNMIFACDTNSLIIDQKKICVSCLSILSFSTTNNEYFHNPVMSIVFSLELDNASNPERISWAFFIKKISAMKSLPSDAIIGFIVDSELNKIKQINQRQEPIFAEDYLPKNVVIIYASSDNGKEFLANKLISSADKAAKDLMTELKKNNSDLSGIPGPDSPIFLRKSRR